jgi:hypothetical protein
MENPRENFAGRKKFLYQHQIITVYYFVRIFVAKDFFDLGCLLAFHPLNF